MFLELNAGDNDAVPRIGRNGSGIDIAEAGARFSTTEALGRLGIGGRRIAHLRAVEYVVEIRTNGPSLRISNAHDDTISSSPIVKMNYCLSSSISLIPETSKFLVRDETAGLDDLSAASPNWRHLTSDVPSSPLLQLAMEQILRLYRDSIPESHAEDGLVVIWNLTGWFPQSIHRIGSKSGISVPLSGGNRRDGFDRTGSIELRSR